MRTPGTAAELERRRRLAVRKLQEGYSVRDVADFFDVCPRTVRRWRGDYQRQGDPGLAAKPPPGRPSRLSTRQVGQVLSWFRKNPKSFGFTNELWTARRVAQIIERKWGIHYNWRYLNSWLARHRITPQKPQRVAREADLDAIERWNTEDWPRLQNGHDASGPLLFSSMKAACC